MDVSALTQLVGSLGFPIVACIALYVRMNKQDELHKEEMSKITESLNNNTIALNRLVDKMDGEKNVINKIQ